MNNSSSSSQVDCPSSVSTTLTVVLAAINLLALSGNFLVILAFVKTVNLKTSPNYYIVNMAISDLVCVILNWPLYATEGMLQPGGSLINNTMAASLFCKLGIYSRALSYAVSILSLVLIAVDRFIATVFPLRSLKITSRIRTIFLLLTWCLPALGFVQYFIYSKLIIFENHSFCRNMMSHFQLKIYSLVGFSLFYCVPLFSIVILYSLIVKHLRKRRKLKNAERTDARAKRLKQNQNIMKIFGSIVLGFFTCWTPMYVYMFLKSHQPTVFTKDKCLLLNLVGIFYYIFPLLSTAINPFILITFSSSYRGFLRRLCCCFLQRVRSARHIVPGAITPQGQTIELLELNMPRRIINHQSVSL